MIPAITPTYLDYMQDVITDVTPALKSSHARKVTEDLHHCSLVFSLYFVAMASMQMHVCLMTCFAGICISFEVMESYESPNVPFSTLKMRFKKVTSVFLYTSNLVVYSS